MACEELALTPSARRAACPPSFHTPHIPLTTRGFMCKCMDTPAVWCVSYVHKHKPPFPAHSPAKCCLSSLRILMVWAWSILGRTDRGKRQSGPANIFPIVWVGNSGVPNTQRQGWWRERQGSQFPLALGIVTFWRWGPEQWCLSPDLRTVLCLLPWKPVCPRL